MGKKSRKNKNHTKKVVTNSGITGFGSSSSSISKIPNQMSDYIEEDKFGGRLTNKNYLNDFPTLSNDSESNQSNTL